jgi:hypothetical protein
MLVEHRTKKRRHGGVRLAEREIDRRGSGIDAFEPRIEAHERGSDERVEAGRVVVV